MESSERQMEAGGSGAAPPGGRSGHLHHAHGVGVTGARAPAAQDTNVHFPGASPGSLPRCALPCSRRLTDIHGEVDAQVDVLGPHVVGRLGVEHGEDAAVQVRLAGRLGVTGHGQDGRTGPVPGDQVGGPADTIKCYFRSND
ncbi:hypothetical protein EYF80_044574 [Liparis tanakae]|uniref:Uncharacterized protein n=1 Tax=Liparis tanakae TaxID=230148 RepID=A0A4Z2FWC2_9TELE|nr:hypothetical protein EYF80_044574 [Liparis tanakae]